MKSLLFFVFTAALLTTGTSRAQPGGAVSLDFFYENLDPYGDWREVGDYGYCWQPRDVNPDWSPYSDGRWLYSDVGWTWDSDEPYSWAVYHYGRWANVASIGWIWVPGTQWGPGWVSWRNNSQYTGWAPLPPEARFQVSIGFSGWVDDYYGIGPGSYRFVQNRQFGSRNLGSVFIDRSQNYTIINQTTNITNIRYENNSIRNDGPRYADISRMTSDPLPRYNLQRRQDFDGDSRRHSPDHLRSRLDGDSLSVFAPPMDERRPSSGPGRHAEKVDDARINRGWDRAGSPDEIAALRSKMKGTSDIPKDLPPPPRLDRREAPSTAPSADRPPGPRDSDTKGKPPALDTPPAGRPGPGPGKDKEDQKKRPPGKTPPTEKPSPEPKVKTPQPPRPDTQRPDMKKPEVRKPESQKPDTQRPEMKKPEARKPQPQIPQAKKPEERKPQAQPPQTRKPETKRPEANRPEMKKPEPQQRAPKKPETRPEPPKREQPQAKAPQQKKPEASRPAPQSRSPAAPKPQSGKGKGGKPDKKKSDEDPK
jgi:hypothetical protein